MTLAEFWQLAQGTVLGLTFSSVFIVVLFFGFCIILGFPKLRVTAGRKFMTIKSLDETVGQEAYARYLPASSPRGPIDVLRTPELLEHKK